MADPATYRPATGEIPTGPGVYRFIDAQGVVIYVGKAISLRSRLSSYFADPAGLHHRTRTMVFTAVKVEWTQVRNELEALQLEYTWIKQFDPRFNVKYRDDKSYPWLAVTWSEEFPRAYVGRGAKRRGWRYFGPYGQAWAIRDSVDSLLTVFPIRTCSQGVFRTAQGQGRPCLMGYIGKCSAPCVGRIDAANHRQIVSDFCDVMAGRITPYLRRFENAMAAAAETQEYEQAARWRDHLQALTKVAERNAVVLPDGTSADVIALAVDPLEVAVQLFTVRDGRIVGERGWVADRADDTAEAGLIEAFCLQIYADQVSADLESAERRRVIPAEILVPQLPASHDELAELLASERTGPVRIRTPRRGAKRDLLATAEKNAADLLTRHKTRRASDLTTRNRALQEIQEALGLPVAPLRIECYDISHLMGTDVVASMVVFEDGLARKSEYRRFLVRSVASNDVGAMREVLTRRFKRLREEQALLRASRLAEDAPTTASQAPESSSAPPLADLDPVDPTAGLIDATTRQAKRFAYPPALIVVDGGAPQVAAAQSVLNDLGVTDVALCGLAKRLEEVWLPGEDYPLILPRTSEGMYLLQRVRDEAHRFAITYHRQRRGRSMLESLLDAVPGLGEVRRKALLR
ncbi:MAG: excinuclease ABC subunit UvrC, partial [Propionibacteriaceae bacterium]|nr:excinuclease ABC subunit UvrC [Propionibacteriaceae bacterium]